MSMLNAIRGTGIQLRTLRDCLLVLLLAAVPVAAQVDRDEVRGDDAYRIGPEDVLSIQVWGKPELTGTAVVDLTGLVRLAVLGEMSVSGRTPAELSRDLTARYQLFDPSVSEVLVSVEQYLSRSLNVIGEVRNAGTFGFRELPDLWGALLRAGGPTPTAELGRVQVIREHASPGGERLLVVDLSRGVDGTPAHELPVLKPKDTILVPSSDEVATGGDVFHVLGAVRSPGPYRLSMASNVIEAISAAGGYLSEANLKKVYLTRRDGVQVQSFRLDLKEYIQDGQPIETYLLVAGDTITVPEQGSFWRRLAAAASFIISVSALAIAAAR